MQYVVQKLSYYIHHLYHLFIYILNYMFDSLNQKIKIKKLRNFMYAMNMYTYYTLQTLFHLRYYIYIYVCNNYYIQRNN